MEGPHLPAMVRRISSLPERPMKREVTAEYLRSLRPPEAVDALRTMIEGLAKGHAGLTAIFQSVSDALEFSPLLSYDWKNEVYGEARRQGLKGVMDLFLSLQPVETAQAEDLQGDLLFKQITLGMRKSMARGRDRDLLTRLALDHDPAVLANLLQNPLITEGDVVRIAARRPNLPVILETIASSLWFRRYRVKLALANNPYSPPRLALTILPHLLQQDLKDIKACNSLHREVRQGARRYLRPRAPETEDR